MKKILLSKTFIAAILTVIMMVLQSLGLYELPALIYGALVASGLLYDFNKVAKKKKSERKISRQTERKSRREERKKNN